MGRAGTGTRGQPWGLGDRKGLESSWLCSWSLSGIHQGGPALYMVSSLGGPSPSWGWGQVWGPQEVLLVPVGWVMSSTTQSCSGTPHKSLVLLWGTPWATSTALGLDSRAGVQGAQWTLCFGTPKVTAGMSPPAGLDPPGDPQPAVSPGPAALG